MKLKDLFEAGEPEQPNKFAKLRRVLSPKLQPTILADEIPMADISNLPTIVTQGLPINRARKTTTRRAFIQKLTQLLSTTMTPQSLLRVVVGDIAKTAVNDAVKIVQTSEQQHMIQWIWSLTDALEDDLDLWGVSDEDSLTSWCENCLTIPSGNIESLLAQINTVSEQDRKLWWDKADEIVQQLANQVREQNDQDWQTADDDDDA